MKQHRLMYELTDGIDALADQRARLLSRSARKPLCGVTAGPWSVRAFDFLRLMCYECQRLVLSFKPTSRA